MRTHNRLIRLVLFTMTTSTLLLTGAGLASAGASCHEERTDETTTLVELTAMCFRPTIVRVDAGATVEFANRDPLAHNIVGHASTWGHVAGLPFGDSYSATFEEAGIYPFTCTIHPGMVGAVFVGDGGAAAPSTSTPASVPWQPFAALAASVAFLTGFWHWSKPRDQVGASRQTA